MVKTAVSARCTIGRLAMHALCACALLWPPRATAEGLKPESPVSFSGFGTVGITYNDTGKAEFLRDVMQPRGIASGWSGNTDSRLGLQLNVQPLHNIEGVLQIVSYYNYAGKYDPQLEWAFAGYSPTPDLKLRVGRLGWDVYMLADSRNVGYSYLWVRPPVEYFGQLLISHIDGADAVYKQELNDGIASVKLYGGRADQKFPVPPGPVYDLEGTRVAGVNFDYQRGSWFFRAGYTAIKVNNELPVLAPLLATLRAIGNPAAATLASDMALSDKTIKIASAGVVYEHGPWQAQLMANRLTSNSLAYPGKDSGYFLLGYRMGQWTPYATIAGAWSDAAPQRTTGLPAPNPLDPAVAAALAFTQSRQHAVSLGMRYDFARNAALKVQLDRVRVHDGAALLWRNPQPDWNGRATIVTLTLDFVF